MLLHTPRSKVPVVHARKSIADAALVDPSSEAALLGCTEFGKIGGATLMQAIAPPPPPRGRVSPLPSLGPLLYSMTGAPRSSHPVWSQAQAEGRFGNVDIRGLSLLLVMYQPVATLASHMPMPATHQWKFHWKCSAFRGYWDSVNNTSCQVLSHSCSSVTNRHMMPARVFGQPCMR